MGDVCVACDEVYVLCCVVLSPIVLCCVVLWCVEVYGVLWCVMWCVPSFSIRAGGVLFKTRTQYQRVLGIIFPKGLSTGAIQRWFILAWVI